MTSLPYPEPDGTRTSGHSGTDTSRERAVRERDEGITAKRQARVVYLLDQPSGFLGITVKELRHVTGWHHGQASATLSNMHKAGRLAMLEARRDRCHIYVLPEQVGERPVVRRGDSAAEREFRIWSHGYKAALGEEYINEGTLRSLFNILWKDTQ